MVKGHRRRLDGLTRALPQRLNANNPDFLVISQLHDEAVSQNRPCYRDPTSGYSVFTAVFLNDRGYCCESGCRHCPFEPLQ
ncbi:MAG: hypothetical protein EXQ66_06335 [Ilumatobacteraceae bacterium]|nr:hypothetical protein [Ilumatobacteraceae bacterium]